MLAILMPILLHLMILRNSPISKNEEVMKCLLDISLEYSNNKYICYAIIR